MFSHLLYDSKEGGYYIKEVKYFISVVSLYNNELLLSCVHFIKS